MNIVVCIKQVPDTNTRIKIKEGSNSIDMEGVQFVVNPYDEFAVEEGLKKREQYGGTVTIITIGPQRAKEALRTCLAMGADKAVHLVVEDIHKLDGYLTALMLSKIIPNDFDIILCGKQAIDGDQSQVGIMLAELLNIPHVAVITKLDIDIDNKKVIAHREVEGGTEIIETVLPCILTCQKGINEPRLPSLKGIMSAKKKEIREIGLEAIGLKGGQLGMDDYSTTEVISIFLPVARKGGIILTGGDAKENVKELVRLLKEEAKII